MILPIGLNRPYYRKPLVCYAIMIVCLALTVLQTLGGPESNQAVRWGYIPGYGSLVTLISHMFVHGGWGHLLGNMLFFYLTGFKLEDALGHLKFAIFYIGGGIAANGLHVLFAQNVPVPCVGASGAIAAVMGGFFVLYPHTRIKLIYVIYIARVFIGTTFVPAWLYLGFWFAREVFSFVYLDSGSGIAFGAHVGGFAAGLVWMWAFFGWNQGERMEEDEEGGGYEYSDASV